MVHGPPHSQYSMPTMHVTCCTLQTTRTTLQMQLSAAAETEKELEVRPGVWATVQQGHGSQAP